MLDLESEFPMIQERTKCRIVHRIRGTEEDVVETRQSAKFCPSNVGSLLNGIALGLVRHLMPGSILEQRTAVLILEILYVSYNKDPLRDVATHSRSCTRPR